MKDEQGMIERARAQYIEEYGEPDCGAANGYADELAELMADFAASEITRREAEMADELGTFLDAADIGVAWLPAGYLDRLRGE